MSDTCFVCDRSQHVPTDHAFLSVSDAAAWFDRQPQGAQPRLVIDGVELTYTT